MHHATRTHAGFCLLIITLLATTSLLAAPPATVEFVWGTAHIVSGSGEKLDLNKGSDVQVGDTVVSDTGRVQLRFSDGGFVSLTPHSEFRLNAYSYGATQDGLERVAMELLKGGLRTISGLIGKRNKAAYEMKTSVATIGIRGTEYTVVYDEGVSGTVSAGAIAVCNAGGCLDVPFGMSYYVKDENTKPMFVDKAALLPPPQPVLAEQGQMEGEAAEVESTNARSSGKAEIQHGRSNNSSNVAKHLKHEKTHDLKGNRDNDGFSIWESDGKGSGKVGKGRDEFQSPSTADLGNSQLIAMPTSGKLSNNSLINFDLAASPGVDSSRNDGHGKGNGNFGVVDALNQMSDDILGGSSGKGKKPKK